MTNSKSALDDEKFVMELRQQMIKFASIQLKNEHAAEDAVQEALLAAFKNANSFAGRSSFKTWVFAILKNKIIETLRGNQRTINTSSLIDDDDADGLDHLFDNKGHWHMTEAPVAWSKPDSKVQDTHFWRVFDACLEGLSPVQAQAFMMREFIELDTDEICKNMSISVTNLNVILHRARLRLRECLENKWYAGDECAC